MVGPESVYLNLILLSDLLEKLEPALARFAQGVDQSIIVPVFKTRTRLDQKEEVGNENDQDRVAS